MASNDQLAAALRTLDARFQQLSATVQAERTRHRSVTEEIDAIPGKRIDTWLTGEVSFTAAQQGTRGAPIMIPVSVDGYFVMTHYPMATWRPSAPDTATNYQRTRPVSSFPLPDQVVDADVIDIFYELQDGGSQRNFQNSPRGPGFSRPDNLIPCARPSLFAPNSSIVFTPIYNRIMFDGATPPTEGILHVDFIGYRIIVGA